VEECFDKTFTLKKTKVLRKMWKCLSILLLIQNCSIWQRRLTLER